MAANFVTMFVAERTGTSFILLPRMTDVWKGSYCSAEMPDFLMRLLDMMTAGVTTATIP
jgi:hypothetical protein